VKTLSQRAASVVLLAATTGVALGCAPGRPDAAATAPGSPGTIARQTVANFLSLSFDQTRLLQLEAVEFADASLGCPEPGFGYAQVVTPGYRARVAADGREFDVRVAGNRGRICARSGNAGSSGRPTDR